MFHQHHPPSSSSSMPSYFPHQPHIVRANPPSFPPFPQPVMPPAVAAESALHPPGTDPNTNSSTYVGFEGYPHFYADPSALSAHNWVVPQPDHVGFAYNALPENQIASTSSNALLNANWATQSLGHNATWMNHVKTKFTQPVQCEVCKIDCNSKDVFDKHVLGKKHKKNLENQKNALMENTSSANLNILNQMGHGYGQVVQGTLNVPVTGKNPKSKKRKLVDSGIKADSVMVCSVCNAVCNSQEVFDKHLSGKRHKAQVALTSQSPFDAAIQPQYKGKLKKKPKKNKAVQSAWCEVCKISCNSNEIYAKHLIGKKHLKNAEKVDKAKTDASTSNAAAFATGTIIGPLENPATQTPENLEAKKRKIMESGAAADCVRTCTICNVVCNSQMMFDSHLAGQKHAAMMKKQAVSGMPMLAPSSFTALPN